MPSKPKPQLRIGDHVFSSADTWHGIVVEIADCRAAVRLYDDDDEPTGIVVNVDVSSLVLMRPVAEMATLKESIREAGLGVGKVRGGVVTKDHNLRQVDRIGRRQSNVGQGGWR